MLTRIYSFASGCVVGALPTTVLLYLRSDDNSALTMSAGFVVATLMTLRAHRAIAVWFTGAIVGFVAALIIVWNGDWRVAIYISGLHAVILPVAAGIAAGLLLGLQLDRSFASRVQ